MSDESLFETAKRQLRSLLALSLEPKEKLEAIKVVLDIVKIENGITARKGGGQFFKGDKNGKS